MLIVFCTTVLFTLGLGFSFSGIHTPVRPGGPGGPGGPGYPRGPFGPGCPGGPGNPGQTLILDKAAAAGGGEGVVDLVG